MTGSTKQAPRRPLKDSLTVVGGSAARRGGSATVLVAMLLAVQPPSRLAAQTVIDDFTYDNLRATAVQLDFGPLAATDLESTVAGGVRLDFGRIGPKVRVLLGLSYYGTEFSSAALRDFENRLRAFVIDPSGDDTIRVGQVGLQEFVADMDLQYVVSDNRAATVYAGLGVSIHFANGYGSAINGTFVEDALDGIGAGGNGTLGAEFKVGGPWRVTLDARGVLSSDVSTGSLRAGVMYRFGDGP